MVLGIDLGTTYSLAAYVDPSGSPQIIPNSEGANSTPSVVLFDDGDNIVVGAAAKDSCVIRPLDVVSEAKNYMGQKRVLMTRGQKQYSPEMISGFILRKVVQDAESGLGQSVTGVVITVPAYFSDAQRKATEDAALMADIPLLGTINEPTAAALCYVRQYNLRDETVLVYDLGGGTFDVTVLRVASMDQIRVLSTAGISKTGGRFFDQFIVDYVCDQMEQAHGIDLTDDEYADDLQELYLKAETAKTQLSSRTSTSIVLKIGKIKEQIPISRALFESMIAQRYSRTESKVKEALKEAGCTPQDIDRVLLVGGSSRIPYIGERLEAFFGKKPCRDLNPDEAVALGAALYAQMLQSSSQRSAQFTDVCSHSIGVVVLERGREENEVIIPRNSAIPVSAQQTFRTSVPNQRKIDLTITEGEFRELSDVTVIGTFEIDLPAGLSGNSLVLIDISLDQHQLIHVHVALPEISFSQEYQLQRIANLDKEALASATGIVREHRVS